MAALTFAAAVAGMPQALGQARYHAFALGEGTTANGINAAGHVVGTVETSGGPRAFLWTGGELQLLGIPGDPKSWATAINDRGEVAGHMEAAGGRTRAWLWRDGRVYDLGTLPGHADSFASGLNNAGWVVGTSRAGGAGGYNRAFLHDGRTMWDLGTLGGSNSAARAINDAGQVVGEADTASHPSQAFLYARGTMIDLADRSFFSTNSSAIAINNSGQIAGFQNWVSITLPGTFTDVWLYMDGRKIPVDCRSWRCVPIGLNDAGRMLAGVSRSVIPGEFGRFLLWDLASGSADIDALGWHVTSAKGINGRDQITAHGCNVDSCQALRLDPLRERRAVEYFHAGFGHYFITAIEGEIAALDTAPSSAWTRTGRTFNVFDEGPAPLAPVCRFWSDQSFAPKSSHFYTPYVHECDLLKAGTTWRYEGEMFSLRLPEGTPGSKACPSGTQPLYRAYNNNLSGAPNHRYTTDPALLDQMIAQGWTMEGEATTRAFACVPLQDRAVSVEVPRPRLQLPE
ncbi:MAG: hypothetical protein OEX23_12095 [Betaproteobacteria bacterium]|nr:hypothetical protein [Betaproteobacteria bacterium]